MDTGTVKPKPPPTPRKKKYDNRDSIVWPYELTINLAKSAKPKVCFGSGEERKYYPENPGHSRLGVMESMGQHKGDVPNPNYFPPPLGVLKPISNKGYGISGLLSERFPKNLGKYEVRPEVGTYQTIHMHEPRPKLTDITNPILIRQCNYGFGTHTTVPRFGVTEKFFTPGPGTHNLGEYVACVHVKSHDSFGGRKCITPTTITICRCSGGERCVECGEEQLFDYYRSKSRIYYPNTKQTGSAKYIAMCRKCYCFAYNGHHPDWTKKLLTVFRKARHCSYKHDHHKLPEFLTKVFPKELSKLGRKEVILWKDFPDFCPADIYEA